LQTQASNEVSDHQNGVPAQYGQCLSHQPCPRHQYAANKEKENNRKVYALQQSQKQPPEQAAQNCHLTPVMTGATRVVSGSISVAFVTIVSVMIVTITIMFAVIKLNTSSCVMMIACSHC